MHKPLLLGKMAEESRQSLEDSTSTQQDEEESLSFPRITEESPTHEMLTEEVFRATALDFANYLVINNQQEVRHTSRSHTKSFYLLVYVIAE